MMPTEHPNAARRRLAAALRGLREDTGLSAELFGELLSFSSAKVFRLENGRTVPRPREAQAWASAAGRPDRGPELAALVAAVSRGEAADRAPGDAHSEEAGVAASAAEVARVFRPARIHHARTKNTAPRVVLGENGNPAPHAPHSFQRVPFLHPAACMGVPHTRDDDIGPGRPCSDCCHAMFTLPEGAPHLTVNWACTACGQTVGQAGGYHNRHTCGTGLNAP